MTVLVALLCLVTGLILTPESAAAAERPNLLVIAIDTLRADHLGCYGADRPTSPSIDAIAARGLRFEAAMSTSPWTLPSFASSFTGRYPTRHGAGLSGELRNLADQLPAVLSGSVPTLAELLSDQGYATQGVASNPYLLLGLQRGFDSFVCRSFGADRVGALTRARVDALDSGRPFFLFAHFNDPHEPTDAAEVFLGKIRAPSHVLADRRRGKLERWGEGEDYLGRVVDLDAAAELREIKIALYDAAIRQVDYEIARILDALEARGRLENTVVVILSDHGEEFLEHAAAERARAEDPRGIWGIGHGHTLYSEQLHVPLILMGPGIEPGIVQERLSMVDFMPTLLGYLGVEYELDLDGRDRRDWIADEERRPLDAFAEAIAYGPDRVALMSGQHKLISDRFGTPRALFDLASDPLEQHDLLGTLDPDSLRMQLIELEQALSDGAPAATALGELNDEMIEALRALGYVQ